jgi:diguanylate cyclase (GGDEF)-like protein
VKIRSLRTQLDLVVAAAALPALVAMAVLLFVEDAKAPLYAALLAVVPALFALVALRLAAALRRRIDALRGENFRLAHHATHDALTGLVNRPRFEALLNQRLKARGARGLTLLYVDMDGFKQVNDKHGHDVGDVVLRLFASRLSAGVRASDVVGRLGGDEFAVILDGLGVERAVEIADQLIDRLSRPYAVGALKIEVSASIGLAASPQAGVTSAALTKAADAAMYRAKGSGRHRYEVSDFSAL